MIFSSLKDEAFWKTLDPAVCRALEYASRKDLRALEPGSFALDEDRLFFNRITLKSASKDQCSWEVHRRYLDIHLCLEGEERIDLGFLDAMNPGEYDAQSDSAPVQGNKSASIVLHPQEFLICWPQDVHRPGIQVEKPETVEKAVFKIRIG